MAQLASFMSELHSDGLLEEDAAATADAPADDRPSVNTVTAFAGGNKPQTASEAGLASPTEQSIGNEGMGIVSPAEPLGPDVVEPDDASEKENISNPDFIGPAIPEGAAAADIGSPETEPQGSATGEMQSMPAADLEGSGDQSSQAAVASTGPAEQRV